MPIEVDFVVQQDMVQGLLLIAIQYEVECSPQLANTNKWESMTTCQVNHPVRSHVYHVGPGLF